MSAPRFFIAIVTILVLVVTMLNINLDTTELVGMVVVVPCLTAALYRAFTVFGIVK